jgi:hypothetical protein
MGLQVGRDGGDAVAADQHISMACGSACAIDHLDVA